jgi:hypothetical protein
MKAKKDIFILHLLSFILSLPPPPMAVVPDWKAGSNSALRTWLVLMIIFFILGYDWVLSIVMGAIGGAAQWVIAAYLNAKDDERIVKASKTVVIEEKEVTEPTSKRMHVRRYGESSRQRERKSVRRFGWLFRKK